MRLEFWSFGDLCLKRSQLLFGARVMFRSQEGEGLWLWSRLQLQAIIRIKIRVRVRVRAKATPRVRARAIPRFSIKMNLR